MNCKKCGKKIKKDAKYCPDCGSKQKKLDLFDVTIIGICVIAFILMIASMKKDMDDVFEFGRSVDDNWDKVVDQLYNNTYE